MISHRGDLGTLTSDERFNLQVIAVGADGDGAAPAGREDEGAAVPPSFEYLGVRVAVRGVGADADDGERGPRGADEAVGRGGAEVFIGETFAQYSCVCIT